MMPHGLYVYLDSFDITHMDRTMRLLRRCGAVGALPVIESVDGRRQPASRLRGVCDLLLGADILPVPFSFPNLSGNVGESAAFYVATTGVLGLVGQWDVEPLGRERRWKQSELDTLLGSDEAATITTTRAQLPSLDVRGREVWLQLEGQTSTERVDELTKRWTDVVLVTGLFDEEKDPRTIAEVRRDLDRCTAQAQRVGKHAVWAAHTMSDAEADVLREWSLATWKAPS